MTKVLLGNIRGPEGPAGPPGSVGGTMTTYLALKVVELTDNALVDFDASAGNIFDWTLSGDSHRLSAPANPQDGQIIAVRISYTGSFVPLFDIIYDFANESPAWTALAGKADEVTFRYNAASSKWRYQGAEFGYSS